MANKIVTKVATRKRTSVPAGVLVFVAWRNLMHKKLRAFLTIFGVVIGIGAIYFLLSFGIGLQHLVTEQIIGSQSVKAVDITSTNSKILQLNQSSMQKIKNLPHVVRVGGSFSYAASISYKGADVDAVTYGVDQNYQTLSNLSPIAGRLLSPDDNTAVVINKAALPTLGIKNPGDVLGKKLKLKIPLELGSDKNVDGSFTVVGVLDAGAGTEIYVPNHVFEMAGAKNYTQVKLEADKSEYVHDLRNQIESLGFTTTSPLDTIDQINQIFKFFNILLVGFGAIGMIVAVLGMFNTLTISLLERTREIGLMLALGGRNRDMKKLFILEAILLSLTGAIVGIIFAWLMGTVVNIIMNVTARGRGVTQSFDLFATPLWLTGGTILFMTFVGLAVVYFPARRAEHINPIDALRRE